MGLRVRDDLGAATKSANKLLHGRGIAIGCPSGRGGAEECAVVLKSARAAELIADMVVRRHPDIGRRDGKGVHRAGTTRLGTAGRVGIVGGELRRAVDPGNLEVAIHHKSIQGIDDHVHALRQARRIFREDIALNRALGTWHERNGADVGARLDGVAGTAEGAVVRDQQGCRKQGSVGASGGYADCPAPAVG